MPRTTTSVAPLLSLAAASLDAGEVVLLLGQAQQRQRALGVMLPQPVERALGTGKRIGQRAVGQAVLADGLGERAVDGLNQGHGLSAVMPGFEPGMTLGTQRPCLPKQDGRDKPGDDGGWPAHSGAPIEVTPLGLPTTVVSMPPPYSRLATRLASSMVTASIRAPRRCI